MSNQVDSDLEIREQIEMGKALERMKNTDDFKLVIANGYIKRTLVVDSQGITSDDPYTRQKTLDLLMAVNYFRDHLNGVTNDAISATESLGA